MVHPLHLLQKRWKMITLVSIFFGICAFAISFAFPWEYRAEAQVFILSSSRYGVDPYTVVKSAERVGENMVQIMKTNDFYQKVRSQPGFGVEWSTFDRLDELHRRKKWHKTVEANVVYGTSVLSLRAYNIDSDQAKALAGAMAATLVSNGTEYVGSDVAFKIVNDPVVSERPVRPNIILNILIGLVLGFLVSVFVVVRRE